MSGCGRQKTFNEEEMEVFCECESFTCNKTINISISERMKYLQNKLTLIIKGCKLSKDDILIKDKGNYLLVREKQYS